MKKIVILFAVLLLYGCVTPEKKTQLQLEKQKTLVLEDQNKCIKYGFSKGTDQFSNCMMQLDISRNEEKALKKALRCEREKQRQANKKGPSLSGWGALLEGAIDGAALSDC